MVLFAWMQFLKEETLSYLQISSPYELKMCHGGSGQSGPPPVPPDAEQRGDAACAAAAGAEILDARAVQDVESLSSLIREILDSDQAQRRKCFDSKMFLCNICFCEKLGSECMYFMECSHVYCRACLKDYFEIQIRDGQVQCLNCPDSECSSVATPGQVTNVGAVTVELCNVLVITADKVCLVLLSTRSVPGEGLFFLGSHSGLC